MGGALVVLAAFALLAASLLGFLVVGAVLSVAEAATRALEGVAEHRNAQAAGVLHHAGLLEPLDEP